MEFHKIWIKQCEAVERITKRYGKKSSIRYLIEEKFLNFLEECDERPEFAEELPKFVQKVREIFEPQEISGFLDELLREQARDRGKNRAFDDFYVLIGRAKAMLLGAIPR